MEDLISVITTVKNGENTLENTIKSVISQTYNNLEYIIVDDGSIDNTINILKQYDINYNGLKIILTDGIGRAKALNLAISEAKGKYIANIDADDLMHPQRIEIQYNYIKDRNNLLLVSTPTEYIYDNQKFETKKLNINEIKMAYCTTKQVSQSLLIRNNISHISILINKNKLKSLGCYNENRLTQVDYELWLRGLYEHFEMEIINLKLSAKRLHRNQSFENKNRKIYTFNSLKLQTSYIMKMRKYYFLPFSIISYMLSFLPLKVRMIISRTLNKVFTT